LSAFEQQTITGIMQATKLNNMPAYFIPNNSELLGNMYSIISNRIKDEEFLSYIDKKVCP
jgi:hypothetical protein